MRRPTDIDNRHISVFLTGLVVLFTFTSMAIGYYLPPERGEIGIVFAPWMSQTDAATAITKAGGSIAGNGRFSNIWIAFAHDSGFAERVRHEGAWFLTSARGLCAPIFGETA